MIARLVALLAQRCPRCLRGRIFAGLMRLHVRCGSCELPLVREPGYYVGAVYFGYALGLAEIVPTVIALLRAGAGDAALILIASAQLLLLSPVNFRYGRVLWLHLDQILGLSRQDRDGGEGG